MCIFKVFAKDISRENVHPNALERKRGEGSMNRTLLFSLCSDAGGGGGGGGGGTDSGGTALSLSKEEEELRILYCQSILRVR